MGLRFSFGVGPLRASVPLTKRRTYRRRPGPSSPSSSSSGVGCLVLLVVVGIIALVSGVQGCAAGPSPAQTLMGKIPGCTGVSTSGGNSLDDNTVSEGSCTLNDGTEVNVYLWAAGDTSDLEQYVYISSGDGCCVVGTKPQPWAVSFDYLGVGNDPGDWSAVEDALSGQAVPNPPSSWQDGGGVLPIPASSPWPSPSPSHSSRPRHRVHHRHSHPHRRHVIVPVPVKTHNSGAWCTADAVYNTTYSDYDVYVHSNQPDEDVTASANNGESMTYYTNSSGYADVYLYADPGNSITVQVGDATCSTTAG
jgi:hypothetical protein